MAPPNGSSEAAISTATAQGRDAADHMGFARSAQALYDDLSRQPDPALRRAELQGATQELTRLGMLPNLDIETRNFHTPTNYDVVDTTRDHKELVIAAGDHSQPHLVVMDSQGHFYNAVADTQPSESHQKAWTKSDQIAANAMELERSEGHSKYNKSVIERDSNNLPIEVKTGNGTEWRVARSPDGTQKDIVSMRGNELHAFSKNPDGSYTSNGQRSWITIEQDGTFSYTGLKNMADAGSTPNYQPDYNFKQTPTGDIERNWTAGKNQICWKSESYYDSYGVANTIDIKTDSETKSYHYCQQPKGELPEYKNSDQNDTNTYRFNVKLGKMLPVH